MTDFNRLIEYVKEKHTGHPFAGFDHVERVHQICLELAKGLEVDEELLRTAAYLHDIAVPVFGAERHNERAAEVAADLLEEIGFPATKKAPLFEAIHTHTRYYETNPQTVEAKILKDADGIDYIGTVGILRGVVRSLRNKSYDGNVSENATKMMENLIATSAGTFSTDKGQKMAEDRMNAVKRYIAEIQAEMQQKAE
jgi:uncharacterized protein